MYTFTTTTTTHEEHWNYTFSFAIQTSSGNMWWIWELRLYNKVPVHIKKRNWASANHLEENRDPFCYNMHFIHWMNICHTDFMYMLWLIKCTTIHVLVYYCHKNITNSTIPVFLQFNTTILKLQTLWNYVITDAVKIKLDKDQCIHTKFRSCNGAESNNTHVNKRHVSLDATAIEWGMHKASFLATRYTVHSVPDSPIKMQLL